MGHMALLSRSTPRQDVGTPVGGGRGGAVWSLPPFLSRCVTCSPRNKDVHNSSPLLASLGAKCRQHHPCSVQPPSPGGEADSDPRLFPAEASGSEKPRFSLEVTQLKAQSEAVNPQSVAKCTGSPKHPGPGVAIIPIFTISGLAIKAFFLQNISLKENLLRERKTSCSVGRKEK